MYTLNHFVWAILLFFLSPSFCHVMHMFFPLSLFELKQHFIPMPFFLNIKAYKAEGHKCLIDGQGGSLARPCPHCSGDTDRIVRSVASAMARPAAAAALACEGSRYFGQLDHVPHMAQRAFKICASPLWASRGKWRWKQVLLPFPPGPTTGKRSMKNDGGGGC